MPNKSKKASDVGKYFNGKLSSLNKRLSKSITKELLKIGDDIVGKTQKYIDAEWYDTYDPKSYIRTYDFRNAIRYTVSDNKLRIYFDRRRFSTSIVNNGVGWQPHRGFDGEVFVTGLIDFIADGSVSGGTHKNPRYNDGNIGLIEYVENEVNNYVDKLIKYNMKTWIKKYL